MHSEDGVWQRGLRRSYQCRRVGTQPDWSTIPWTQDFIDIACGAPPPLRTRAKMAWNDAGLLVHAQLDDADVWASVTQANEPVFHDNAFELFLDPDGDGRSYYELQINASGTTCELQLSRPYRDGGKARACPIPGLLSQVRIAGPINEPAVRNDGWSIDLMMPWAGLARFHARSSVPPQVGDCWRLNLARVHWPHKIADGRYQRVPPHGATTRVTDKAHWVWSPQGEVNMHLPKRWGDLRFVSGS